MRDKKVDMLPELSSIGSDLFMISANRFKIDGGVCGSAASAS